MFRITFHITEQCNMACTYCYEHKRNRVIEFNTAKEFIDEIIKYKLGQETFLKPYFDNDAGDRKSVELDFIGGEVTLYMPLVEEICDYWFKKCADNKLVDWFCYSTIILETNGTTYFNDDVQNFLNKYKGKCSLPITIDGCKECHDKCRHYKDGSPTFDDVDKAVKSYIEEYGVPNSKMTFTPESLPYLLDSCKYLYSLGYEYARMNLDVTKKITISTYRKYYTELIKVADWILDNKLKFIPSVFTYSFTSDKIASSCGMLGNQIAIDVSGNIYNCFRMAESSMGDKYRPIGNILTKTLDMDMVNDFLNRISAHTHHMCQECPIQSTCEECPADNYLINGDYFESWNNCGETLAEAKANKYFIEKARRVNYPYFHEYLDKVRNEYDPDYYYLINWEYFKNLDEEELEDSNSSSEE